MNMRMRRLECKILFAVMLLMMCQSARGQYLYDRNNMTIGKIDPNGYVYDRSNMTIGRFKADDVIVNRSVSVLKNPMVRLFLLEIL